MGDPEVATPADASIGRRMIFVDYLGAPSHLSAVREVVKREVAAALRVDTNQVFVRRVVTEGDTDAIELWIELSTDEQLYRLGHTLAQRISAGLREDNSGPNV